MFQCGAISSLLLAKPAARCCPAPRERERDARGQQTVGDNQCAWEMTKVSQEARKKKQ